MVLSHFVETRYVEKLLESNDGRAIGYLLKERVAEVENFAASLRAVAAGGAVIDPTAIRRLLRHRDPLDHLTERERDVLIPMAEGHSNARIARDLVISDSAVGKHTANIMSKLGLPHEDTGINRRVKAVLTFLRR